MNERIKALAIEAGGGPSKWYNDPDVLEYFAQLIVRECAELFPKQNMYGGNAIQNMIKEHFGVTE